MSAVTNPQPIPPASRKEVLCWAMYDTANSTYGTIVATAIYNAYFVKTIVGDTPGVAGMGTVFLSIVVCVSSLAVVATAPIIGTIADATASKKTMLLISTACCITSTAALGFIGPGNYIAAMVVLTISNIAFGTGEDLIAAFLPEIATRENMGKISALGWAAGYVGGLMSLGLAFAYVSWAQHHGQGAPQYVPMVMFMCAACFLVAATPTFLGVRERARPDTSIQGANYVRVGFRRLKETLSRARHYQDLFQFLIALFIYSCGTAIVFHLASVYAQQELHFTTSDSIAMILVVNITAAIGAFVFGFVQDKIGSIRTLFFTLILWTIAVLIACAAQTKMHLWISANIIGLSMGASGSVGRALVSRFSPEGRSGEFLGLWGVAVKLATAFGVLSFGLASALLHNNFRLALLVTVLFFVGGLLQLLRVNEQRGVLSASSSDEPSSDNVTPV